MQILKTTHQISLLTQIFSQILVFKGLGIIDNGNFSISLIPVSTNIDSVSSEINLNSLKLVKLFQVVSKLI